MSTIDVKKIMSDIRMDIQKRGIEEDDILFEDIISDMNPFENTGLDVCIEEVNNSWSVSAYREIKSRGGILGKIIIFFKKAIRKIIKFYVEPIVEDQVVYNTNVVRVLNSVQENIYQNESIVLELKKEIRELKKEIRELKKK